MNDLPSEISNIDHNQEAINSLMEQLNRLPVIPFVGAGLSVDFGFPGWGQFLIDLATEAGIEKKIQEHLKAGNYEAAAGDLQYMLGFLAFHKAISRTFGDSHLNGKQLTGAVSFLPRLVSGPIITTNFDHVLERIFENAGTPFENTFWNSPTPKGLVFRHRRVLLKLHGDVDGDGTDRVLTRKDYERVYGSEISSDANYSSSHPLPTLLQWLLVSRTLLFLGCSLGYDRTMKVLEQVVQDNSYIEHYAIVARPAADEEFRERSSFLSDHNIQPIWYPHKKHDMVEKLLAYLVNNISPSWKSSPQNRALPSEGPMKLQQDARRELEVFIDIYNDIADNVRERSKIIDRMRERASLAQYSSEEISDFLRKREPGARFAGLANVQWQWPNRDGHQAMGSRRHEDVLPPARHPDTGYFEQLLDILLHPQRPFEHYHAIEAMWGLSSHLNTEQRQQLCRQVRDYPFDERTSSEKWGIFVDYLRKNWCEEPRQ